MSVRQMKFRDLDEKEDFIAPDSLDGHCDEHGRPNVMTKRRSDDMSRARQFQTLSDTYNAVTKSDDKPCQVKPDTNVINVA